MVSFTSEQQYYLYPYPMDMRKDIDSLSDIVRQEMCQDPTRLNGVFLFLSSKPPIQRKVAWKFDNTFASTIYKMKNYG